MTRLKQYCVDCSNDVWSTVIVVCLNDCRDFVCQCQQRSTHKHAILMVMQFRGNLGLIKIHQQAICETSCTHQHLILWPSWAHLGLLEISCLGHVGAVLLTSKLHPWVILGWSRTCQKLKCKSSWSHLAHINNQSTSKVANQCRCSQH